MKHFANYLGPVISKEGIARDLTKIDKILNYPVLQ